MSRNENVYYVYKPIGKTPVELLQEFMNETKIEKCGFSGRLDPLAHGKMMILCGEEMKKMSLYHNCDKTYKFKFVVGLQTDTTDFMGIFTNGGKSNCNENDILQDILSQNGSTFMQNYHVFSSFVPKETVEGVRKPLWWWSKFKSDVVLNYAKKVTIYKIDINNIEEINGSVLKKTALNNIMSVKQMTFRNDEIIEQWHKFEPLDKYVEFTCTCTVSSGFYVRQFVKDLSMKNGVKLMVTDIERLDIQMLNTQS